MSDEFPRDLGELDARISADVLRIYGITVRQVITPVTLARGSPKSRPTN